MAMAGAKSPLSPTTDTEHEGEMRELVTCHVSVAGSWGSRNLNKLTNMSMMSTRA